MLTQQQIPAREEPKNQYQTLDHDDLPVLCIDDITSSLDRSNTEFILDFMKTENLGRYLYLEHLGATIQNVGRKVIRCLTVDGDEMALTGLAMLQCTVREVRGKLELAPYTVVIPYVARDQEVDNLD
jgi:hypothetical protein